MERSRLPLFHKKSKGNSATKKSASSSAISSKANSSKPSANAKLDKKSSSPALPVPSPLPHGSKTSDDKNASPNKGSKKTSGIKGKTWGAKGIATAINKRENDSHNRDSGKQLFIQNGCAVSKSPSASALLLDSQLSTKVPNSSPQISHRRGSDVKAEQRNRTGKVESGRRGEEIKNYSSDTFTKQPKQCLTENYVYPTQEHDVDRYHASINIDSKRTDGCDVNNTNRTNASTYTTSKQSSRFLARGSTACSVPPPPPPRRSPLYPCNIQDQTDYSGKNCVQTSASSHSVSSPSDKYNQMKSSEAVILTSPQWQQKQYASSDINALISPTLSTSSSSSAIYNMKQNGVIADMSSHLENFRKYYEYDATGQHKNSTSSSDQDSSPHHDYEDIDLIMSSYRGGQYRQGSNKVSDNKGGELCHSNTTDFQGEMYTKQSISQDYSHSNNTSPLRSFNVSSSGGGGKRGPLPPPPLPFASPVLNSPRLRHQQQVPATSVAASKTYHDFSSTSSQNINLHKQSGVTTASGGSSPLYHLRSSHDVIAMSRTRHSSSPSSSPRTGISTFKQLPSTGSYNDTSIKNIDSNARVLSPSGIKTNTTSRSRRDHYQPLLSTYGSLVVSGTNTAANEDGLFNRIRHNSDGHTSRNTTAAPSVKNTNLHSNNYNNSTYSKSAKSNNKSHSYSKDKFEIKNLDKCGPEQQIAASDNQSSSDGIDGYHTYESVNSDGSPITPVNHLPFKKEGEELSNNINSKNTEPFNRTNSSNYCSQDTDHLARMKNMSVAAYYRNVYNNYKGETPPDSPLDIVIPPPGGHAYFDFPPPPTSTSATSREKTGGESGSVSAYIYNTNKKGSIGTIAPGGGIGIINRCEYNISTTVTTAPESNSHGGNALIQCNNHHGNASNVIYNRDSVFNHQHTGSLSNSQGEWCSSKNTNDRGVNSFNYQGINTANITGGNECSITAAAAHEELYNGSLHSNTQQSYSPQYKSHHHTPKVDENLVRNDHLLDKGSYSGGIVSSGIYDRVANTEALYSDAAYCYNQSSGHPDDNDEFSTIVNNSSVHDKLFHLKKEDQSTVILTRKDKLIPGVELVTSPQAFNDKVPSYGYIYNMDQESGVVKHSSDLKYCHPVGDEDIDNYRKGNYQKDVYSITSPPYTTILPLSSAALSNQASPRAITQGFYSLYSPGGPDCKPSPSSQTSAYSPASGMASSPLFGRKHSFPSPSCGIRMAELRAKAHRRWSDPKSPNNYSVVLNLDRNSTPSPTGSTGSSFQSVQSLVSIDDSMTTIAEEDNKLTCHQCELEYSATLPLRSSGSASTSPARKIRMDALIGGDFHHQRIKINENRRSQSMECATDTASTKTICVEGDSGADDAKPQFQQQQQPREKEAEIAGKIENTCSLNAKVAAIDQQTDNDYGSSAVLSKTNGSIVSKSTSSVKHQQLSSIKPNLGDCSANSAAPVSVSVGNGDILADNNEHNAAALQIRKHNNYSINSVDNSDEYKHLSDKNNVHLNSSSSLGREDFYQRLNQQRQHTLDSTQQTHNTNSHCLSSHNSQSPSFQHYEKTEWIGNRANEILGEKITEKTQQEENYLENGLFNNKCSDSINNVGSDNKGGSDNRCVNVPFTKSSHLEGCKNTLPLICCQSKATIDEDSLCDCNGIVDSSHFNKTTPRQHSSVNISTGYTSGGLVKEATIKTTTTMECNHRNCDNDNNEDKCSNSLNCCIGDSGPIVLETDITSSKSHSTVCAVNKSIGDCSSNNIKRDGIRESVFSANGASNLADQKLHRHMNDKSNSHKNSGGADLVQQQQQHKEIKTLPIFSTKTDTLKHLSSQGSQTHFSLVNKKKEGIVKPSKNNTNNYSVGKLHNSSQHEFEGKQITNGCEKVITSSEGKLVCDCREHDSRSNSSVSNDSSKYKIMRKDNENIMNSTTTAITSTKTFSQKGNNVSNSASKIGMKSMKDSKLKPPSSGSVASHKERNVKSSEKSSFLKSQHRDKSSPGGGGNNQGQLNTNVNKADQGNTTESNSGKQTLIQASHTGQQRDGGAEKSVSSRGANSPGFSKLKPPAHIIAKQPKVTMVTSTGNTSTSFKVKNVNKSSPLLGEAPNKVSTDPKGPPNSKLPQTNHNKGSALKKLFGLQQKLKVNDSKQSDEGMMVKTRNKGKQTTLSVHSSTSSSGSPIKTPDEEKFGFVSDKRSSNSSRKSRMRSRVASYSSLSSCDPMSSLPSSPCSSQLSVDSISSDTFEYDFPDKAIVARATSSPTLESIENLEKTVGDIAIYSLDPAVDNDLSFNRSMTNSDVCQSADVSRESTSAIHTANSDSINSVDSMSSLKETIPIPNEEQIDIAEETEPILSCDNQQETNTSSSLPKNRSPPLSTSSESNISTSSCNNSTTDTLSQSSNLEKNNGVKTTASKLPMKKVGCITRDNSITSSSSRLKKPSINVVKKSVMAAHVTDDKISNLPQININTAIEVPGKCSNIATAVSSSKSIKQNCNNSGAGGVAVFNSKQSTSKNSSKNIKGNTNKDNGGHKRMLYNNSRSSFSRSNSSESNCSNKSAHSSVQQGPPSSPSPSDVSIPNYTKVAGKNTDNTTTSKLRAPQASKLMKPRTAVKESTDKGEQVSTKVGKPSSLHSPNLYHNQKHPKTLPTHKYTGKNKANAVDYSDENIDRKSCSAYLKEEHGLDEVDACNSDDSKMVALGTSSNNGIDNPLGKQPTQAVSVQNVLKSNSSSSSTAGIKTGISNSSLREDTSDCCFSTDTALGISNTKPCGKENKVSVKESLNDPDISTKSLVLTTEVGNRDKCVNDNNVPTSHPSMEITMSNKYNPPQVVINKSSTSTALEIKEVIKGQTSVNNTNNVSKLISPGQFTASNIIKNKTKHREIKARINDKVFPSLGERSEQCDFLRDCDNNKSEKELKEREKEEGEKLTNEKTTKNQSRSGKNVLIDGSFNEARKDHDRGEEVATTFLKTDNSRKISEPNSKSHHTQFGDKDNKVLFNIPGVFKVVDTQNSPSAAIEKNNSHDENSGCLADNSIKVNIYSSENTQHGDGGMCTVKCHHCMDSSPVINTSQMYNISEVRSEKSVLSDHHLEVISNTSYASAAVTTDEIDGRGRGSTSALVNNVTYNDKLVLDNDLSQNYCSQIGIEEGFGGKEFVKEKGCAHETYDQALIGADISANPNVKENVFVMEKDQEEGSLIGCSNNNDGSDLHYKRNTTSFKKSCSLQEQIGDKDCVISHSTRRHSDFQVRKSEKRVLTREGNIYETDNQNEGQISHSLTSDVKSPPQPHPMLVKPYASLRRNHSPGVSTVQCHNHHTSTTNNRGEMKSHYANVIIKTSQGQSSENKTQLNETALNKVSRYEDVNTDDNAASAYLKQRYLSDIPQGKEQRFLSDIPQGEEGEEIISKNETTESNYYEEKGTSPNAANVQFNSIAANSACQNNSLVFFTNTTLPDNGALEDDELYQKQQFIYINQDKTQIADRSQAPASQYCGAATTDVHSSRCCQSVQEYNDNALDTDTNNLHSSHYLQGVRSTETNSETVISPRDTQPILHRCQRSVTSPARNSTSRVNQIASINGTSSLGRDGVIGNDSNGVFDGSKTAIEEPHCTIDLSVKYTKPKSHSRGASMCACEDWVHEMCHCKNKLEIGKQTKIEGESICGLTTVCCPIHQRLDGGCNKRGEKKGNCYYIDQEQSTTDPNTSLNQSSISLNGAVSMMPSAGAENKILSRQEEKICSCTHPPRNKYHHHPSSLGPAMASSISALKEKKSKCEGVSNPSNGAQNNSKYPSLYGSTVAPENYLRSEVIEGQEGHNSDAVLGDMRRQCDNQNVLTYINNKKSGEENNMTCSYKPQQDINEQEHPSLWGDCPSDNKTTENDRSHSRWEATQTQIGLEDYRICNSGSNGSGADGDCIPDERNHSSAKRGVKKNSNPGGKVVKSSGGGGGGDIEFINKDERGIGNEIEIKEKCYGCSVDDKDCSSTSDFIRDNDEEINKKYSNNVSIDELKGLNINDELVRSSEENDHKLLPEHYSVNNGNNGGPINPLQHCHKNQCIDKVKSNCSSGSSIDYNKSSSIGPNDIKVVEIDRVIESDKVTLHKPTANSAAVSIAGNDIAVGETDEALPSLIQPGEVSQGLYDGNKQQNVMVEYDSYYVLSESVSDSSRYMTLPVESPLFSPKRRKGRLQQQQQQQKTGLIQEPFELKDQYIEDSYFGDTDLTSDKSFCPTVIESPTTGKERVVLMENIDMLNSLKLSESGYDSWKSQGSSSTACEPDDDPASEMSNNCIINEGSQTSLNGVQTNEDCSSDSESINGASSVSVITTKTIQDFSTSENETTTTTIDSRDERQNSLSKMKIYSLEKSSAAKCGIRRHQVKDDHMMKNCMLPTAGVRLGYGAARSTSKIGVGLAISRSSSESTLTCDANIKYLEWDTSYDNSLLAQNKDSSSIEDLLESADLFSKSIKNDREIISASIEHLLQDCDEMSLNGDHTFDSGSMRKRLHFSGSDFALALYTMSPSEENVLEKLDNQPNQERIQWQGKNTYCSEVGIQSSVHSLGLLTEDKTAKNMGHQNCGARKEEILQDCTDMRNDGSNNDTQEILPKTCRCQEERCCGGCNSNIISEDHSPPIFIENNSCKCNRKTDSNEKLHSRHRHQGNKQQKQNPAKFAEERYCLLEEKESMGPSSLDTSDKYQCEENSGLYLELIGNQSVSDDNNDCDRCNSIDVLLPHSIEEKCIHCINRIKDPVFYCSCSHCTNHRCGEVINCEQQEEKNATAALRKRAAVEIGEMIPIIKNSWSSNSTAISSCVDCDKSGGDYFNQEKAVKSEEIETAIRENGYDNNVSSEMQLNRSSNQHLQQLVQNHLLQAERNKLGMYTQPEAVMCDDLDISSHLPSIYSQSSVNRDYGTDNMNVGTVIEERSQEIPNPKCVDENPVKSSVRMCNENVINSHYHDYDQSDDDDDADKQIIVKENIPPINEENKNCFISRNTKKLSLQNSEKLSDEILIENSNISPSRTENYQSFFVKCKKQQGSSSPATSPVKTKAAFFEAGISFLSDRRKQMFHKRSSGDNVTNPDIQSCVPEGNRKLSEKNECISHNRADYINDTNYHDESHQNFLIKTPMRRGNRRVEPTDSSKENRTKEGLVTSHQTISNEEKKVPCGTNNGAGNQRFTAGLLNYRDKVLKNKAQHPQQYSRGIPLLSQNINKQSNSINSMVTNNDSCIQTAAQKSSDHCVKDCSVCLDGVSKVSVPTAINGSCVRESREENSSELLSLEHAQVLKAHSKQIRPYQEAHSYSSNVSEVSPDETKGDRVERSIKRPGSLAFTARKSSGSQDLAIATMLLLNSAEKAGDEEVFSCDDKRDNHQGQAGQEPMSIARQLSHEEYLKSRRNIRSTEISPNTKSPEFKQNGTLILGSVKTRRGADKSERSESKKPPVPPPRSSSTTTTPMGISVQNSSLNKDMRNRSYTMPDDSGNYKTPVNMSSQHKPGKDTCTPERKMSPKTHIPKVEKEPDSSIQVFIQPPNKTTNATDSTTVKNSGSPQVRKLQDPVIKYSPSLIPWGQKRGSNRAGAVMEKLKLFQGEIQGQLVGKKSPSPVEGQSYKFGWHPFKLKKNKH